LLSEFLHPTSTRRRHRDDAGACRYPASKATIRDFFGSTRLWPGQSRTLGVCARQQPSGFGRVDRPASTLGATLVRAYAMACANGTGKTQLVFAAASGLAVPPAILDETCFQLRRIRCVPMIGPALGRLPNRDGLCKHYGVDCVGSMETVKVQTAGCGNYRSGRVWRLHCADLNREKKGLGGDVCATCTGLAEAIPLVPSLPQLLVPHLL
jgi:hypothetical protein